MTTPAMAATSTDDLVTMAALGDEDAKRQLEEQAAALNKAIDPANPQAPAAPPALAAQPPAPQWTAEQLAKAQAAGATPPAPTVQQAPAQANADGGQQTTGNPVLHKGENQGEGENDDDYKERMEKMRKDKATKSMDEVSPEEEALVKAMDIAEGIARGAQSAPDPDRREVLAKSYADDTATPEERAELLDLLKSEVPDDDVVVPDDPNPDDDPLNKGFTQAALEDPAVTAGLVDDDGVDVSGYLGRFSAFVGGSLDTINGNLDAATGNLSKSLDRVHQYNLAQSKANQGLARMVIAQGKTLRANVELIKSLGGRVETVEQRPQPRATVSTATGAKALLKSMDAPGAEGTGTGMSRDDTVRGFTMLMQKSIQGDGEDGKAPCGRDITIDTAHFESHQEIHPEMLANIKTVLGKN